MNFSGFADDRDPNHSRYGNGIAVRVPQRPHPHRPFYAMVVRPGGVRISVHQQQLCRLGSKIFGVTYAPIVIVFIAIAILLGLIIVLLMAVTRLQQRQMQIIRQLAITELAGQEDTERVQAIGAPLADAPNAAYRQR